MLMKKSDIFWQNYLSLEREAIEVSRFIFITDEKVVVKNGVEQSESCDAQLETFSPYIADLIVRCCVQIEAVSKELYFELGGPKQRGDNSIRFDEDCIKEIDKKWHTSQKRVLVVAPSFNLTKEHHKILRPLNNAHKSKGTCWSKAYQALKHDRYSNLHMGNVKAFFQGLAALYLLNLYYRKDSWNTCYKDIGKGDYSMGSSIFAVMPPVPKQIWYNNQPQETESPYVVTYTDDAYKRIEEIQKQERDALNAYWSEQPELKDPKFISHYNKVLEEAKKKTSERVMGIWELAKYRLNKLLPYTMPFDQRKDKLLRSNAWNCRINQYNEHLQPDEITEDNIQSVIEQTAIRWGMQIQKQFEKLEWIPMAMNDKICNVHIP